MSENAQPEHGVVEKKGSSGCLRALGIVAAVVLVAAVVSVLWVRHNVYASYHTPVELSATEREVLETKLDQMKPTAGKGTGGRPSGTDGTARAEPYSEDDSRREISLTEKELNSLLAADPELARKVAVDLADDLVSLNVVAPVDKDVPLVGGKTLRLKAGVSLSYEGGRPVVILRGVSLGGVPIPNAWLGNLKNRDLVEDFGAEGGFWEVFAAGVENLQVREGRLLVTLKK